MTTRLTLAVIAAALALTACDQTAAPKPKAPAASGGSVAGERTASSAPSNTGAPKPDGATPDPSKPSSGTPEGNKPTATAPKSSTPAPVVQPGAPATTPPSTTPSTPTAPKSPPPPTEAPKETVLKHTETNTGLIIDDLKFGDGVEAKAHQTVTIHYRGTLSDGTEFDSSYKTGKPATFGLDSLIKGWQEGIPGMKPGGKRRLIVPPELGYGKREIKGANGQVLIPANSMLIFEIELFGAQ